MTNYGCTPQFSNILKMVAKEVKAIVMNKISNVKRQKKNQRQHTKIYIS